MQEVRGGCTCLREGLECYDVYYLLWEKKVQTLPLSPLKKRTMTSLKKTLTIHQYWKAYLVKGATKVTSQSHQKQGDEFETYVNIKKDFTKVLNAYNTKKLKIERL